MKISFERVALHTKMIYPSGWCLLFLMLVLPRPWSSSQTDGIVRLMDNSDWWSINRGPDSDENVQTQEREFTSSNFQVLGIKLGDTMFRVAAAKLGKATIIERGDASTGRRQVCYASPGNRNKVHLILEQGEVEYTFYLFADGPTWEGADRCVDSGAISTHLATASGVRLGQTPAQVIAILGDPTVKRENELIYSFSVKKKTSAQDLKEARERNPHMSNKDFQETYGSYNLGAGILAKFMDSKLTYLEVSSVESN